MPDTAISDSSNPTNLADLIDSSNEVDEVSKVPEVNSASKSVSKLIPESKSTPMLSPNGKRIGRPPVKGPDMSNLGVPSKNSSALKVLHFFSQNAQNKNK